MKWVNKDENQNNLTLPICLHYITKTSRSKTFIPHFGSRHTTYESVTEQKRIQNPVKHLRWSVLRK